MIAFHHNDESFKVRPLEATEAAELSWPRNDGDWTQLHDPNMYSATHTQKWIENMPASSKRLIIRTHKEPPIVKYDGIWVWQPETVGIIRIDQIDQTNRTCFVGMDIHPKFRGKGISRPAYQWLFWYLFDNLNMNALYLEVLETNRIAVNLYRKVGFTEVGRWPERVYREGVYVDALLFSLLKKDYQAKLKPRS